ncbi:alcohol dehydrogenase-like 2 isoform X2 [Triticum urartu]|uniref:Alcohol dehydrogenase-like 7 n=1 Tax=Triticum urartu TaxID=4572 RepID=A0A8R7TF06_TRIUA|nr:alcohol dehydrogenase-like 2 isoform X2 [Triticum urartu]
MPAGKTMQQNTATKPIRCKAAVCKVAGQPLEMEEVEVAPPRAHEVRVRILCTSLCHTDVTFWRMKGSPPRHPSILGHEAAGVVESVGDDVHEVAVGDTVVSVFLAQCGDCPDCVSDRSNICSGLPAGRPGMPRDGTTRFSFAATGEPINNFLGVSSFTEYTVVDVAQVVRLEPGVPPEKACLLSCGVSTGIGAAWKVAAVEPGSSVAVFGLGAVGLAVAQGCRMRGAKRIIGVDLNPEKCGIGKRLGITDFINPNDIGEKTVSEVVKEMTGGGADYCFECIGSTSVMAEAFQSSRMGWGKTVVLGVSNGVAPMSIPSHDILRGRSVVGSLFGGLKPKTDVPILAQKYLDKEVELDEFVTHEMGFHDINAAFELLVQGKCLRCILWMDGAKENGSVGVENGRACKAKA